MKRALVFTVLLMLLLAAVGTTAAGAVKPQDIPRAGKPAIYLFDVTSKSDPKGHGTFLINLREQTFVFLGWGFQPGKGYHLAYSQGSTDGRPVPLITVADTVADKWGIVYIKGAWTQAFDSSKAQFTINVIPKVGSSPLDAILTADPGPTDSTTYGVPGQWFYLKASTSTGDIVRYDLDVHVLSAQGGRIGHLYDGNDPNLGQGAQGYPYFIPDVRSETYEVILTVYNSAGASDTASHEWGPTV